MSATVDWRARGLSLLRFVAFAAFLGVLFAALADFTEVRAAWHQLQRRDVSNPGFNAGVFVALYGLGLLSLALLYCHAWRWVRWTVLALTGFSVAVHMGVRHWNGVGFTAFEASLLWQELNLLDDALGFYAGSALFGVASGVVVTAVVAWASSRRGLPRLRSPLWLAVPVIAVASFHHLLETTDATVTEFPLPYRPPLLAVYELEYQTHFHGVREAPYLEPRQPPIADHVVFVMDESIRGDLLHVNGGPYENTPYLDSIREKIFDYGVVSSVANLSGGSNIVIQSGVRPDQIPDGDLHSLTNPNVFAYFQRAGFFTAYVNAQDAKSRPPNLMSERDVADLGLFVDLRRKEPDLEEWQVDRHILPIVADVIRSHERSFTWVLKAGVHFPYAGKYPDEARWQGSLQRPDLDDARSTVVRDYLSAMRWTTDGFLAGFVEGLRALGAGRVLIVYTADHGQSLFEADPDHPEWAALRGHGTPTNVPPQQAMVPLMLIPLDAGVYDDLAALYDPALVDHVSAFEIFASLLRLAGYAPDEVARHYHPSVFDRGADRSVRRFVSGNHFGAGGPLYRPAPYRTAFAWNDFWLDREGARARGAREAKAAKTP